MRAVGVADAFEFGVVILEVIVAVGHAEAALLQVGDVLGRVLVVLVDEDADRRIRGESVRGDDAESRLSIATSDGKPLASFTASIFANIASIGLMSSDSSAASSMKLEYRSPIFFVSTFSMFDFPAAASSIRPTQLFLDAIEHDRAGAVVGPVGRDFRRRQPLAVDVLIEVVLHAHAVVDVLHVDARLEGRCGAGAAAVAGGSCVFSGGCGDEQAASSEAHAAASRVLFTAILRSGRRPD